MEVAKATHLWEYNHGEMQRSETRQSALLPNGTTSGTIRLVSIPPSTIYYKSSNKGMIDDSLFSLSSLRWTKGEAVISVSPPNVLTDIGNSSNIQSIPLAFLTSIARL